MKQGSILAFLQSRSDSKALPAKCGSAVVVELSSTTQHTDSSSENGAKESHEAEALDGDKANSLSQSTDRDINKEPFGDLKAAVSKVLPSYLERLKSITATLLPIKYSDKFFSECLEPEKHSAVCFVAIYDSRPVGWIRCRLEPFSNANNNAYTQIYIQALGILAPFRGIGLASELLNATIQASRQAHPNVRGISAHVWETNEDALSWYDKHDFIKVTLLQSYYRRLKPSGAWLVSKDLI